MGHRVIDMELYERDYPGRAEPVALLQSRATYYSFANFDRYVQKCDLSSKLSVSGNLDILKVFSASADLAFSEIFSCSTEKDYSTVYGETTISYYANKYDFSLPSGLYDRIMDGYLDEVFREYMYYSTPEQLFKNYGCFVLSKYISGANAKAIYRAHAMRSSTESFRESEMDALMSANVDVGSLVSGGLSFGAGGGSSSGSTIEHNFSETACPLCTFGGIPVGGNQFTPPKDVNEAFFDLSDWCASLQNSQYHTIADLPDGSLIPLYEFIEEDNLRERFMRIMKRGKAGDTELAEPYVAVNGTPTLHIDGTYYVKVSVSLKTRFGERLMIGETTLPSLEYKDAFTEWIVPRIRAQFPGIMLKIGYPLVEYNPDFELIAATADAPGSLASDVPGVSPQAAAFRLDLSEADINLHEMKRYLDRESGKMYLLFDCPDGSKVAYTIYDPSIMNDYTISNIVKNMPHVTMDVDAIRRNYRLVAL